VARRSEQSGKVTISDSVAACDLVAAAIRLWTDKPG